MMGKYMNSCIKAIVASCLTSILSFGLTSQSGAQKTKNDQASIQQELVSIALASIQAEDDTLISGDSDSALKKNPKAQKALKKLSKTLGKIKEKKDFLEQKKIKYKDSRSNITVKNLTVEGTTAILEVTVDTSKSFDLTVMAAGSPDKTESVTDHKFTFSQDSKGEWELISDEELNTPSGRKKDPTSEEIKNPPLLSNIQPSDPLSGPSQASVLQPQLTANYLWWSPTRGPLFASNKPMHARSLFPMPPIKLAQSTLNRSAIVQYLYYYAKTPNSSYRNFETSGTRGGDCTNFVSQAMRAGGWKDVFNSPFDALSQASRADQNLWWYNSIAQSYTWINAGYFFNFINSRPRAKTIGRVADLVPGDVISADLDPAANDGVDHTMVVSKKANDGTIYLAYHTNNQIDFPFYDFWKTYETSKAQYYAWSLLPSSN
jgi:Putative amidase domain